MNIQRFIESVAETFKTGQATEHSYRPAIQALIQALDEDIEAINEPKRVRCGAPDFVINRNHIPIGHIEAKDIGVDLAKLKDANLDQKKRYLKALPNLIYTNCLDWEFYRNGEIVKRISIGEPLMGIQPKPEAFDELEHFLQDFVVQRPQNITSSKTLASMMAGKAVLIKDILKNALEDTEEPEEELRGQYQAFKDLLIHDITIGDFADIYAETITYGMFAARLHDTSLDDFSRQEALELLPKSNPFLRSLFTYVAGHDLDDRIAWVIDDLADVFQACDVTKLMANFGSMTGRKDPFLHFYEDFLTAYNPKKRKARGVWYTPEAIVNFIVRAVDDVLKSEFGLPLGLADTSKVMVEWDTGQKALTKQGKVKKSGENKTEQKEVHRVQILDPATGTGTFLGEVIKQIAPKIQGVAPGEWSNYIERDLIPRLHGFELLMASYAMCHMKLDMVLTELGYQPTKKPPRLNVFLTNSLEEGEAADQTLPFARWLSDESHKANAVKRDLPIMCIIGNPPYSGESANKGDWIMELMNAYKKEPGGEVKLQERNPKWINDDYVKFIRMSEAMIEKNGEGVLGFITNHGYLDNPTFRGMRWHLLKSFDKIYIIDLHGNSKKKEVAPDGSADKNVFDIMQGVAIVVAVKTSPNAEKNPDLAQVFHADLWGARTRKYEALEASSLASIDWNRLENRAPQYAFINRDYELEERYVQGFAINEFMPVNSVGIVTARDALTIDMDKEALWKRVLDFRDGEPEELRARYNLGKDVRDWTVAFAKKDVIENFSRDNLVPIQYRPFDTRWTYYTGNSRGFHCYPRGEVMQHFLAGENFALTVCRQSLTLGQPNVFLCNKIGDDSYVSNKSKERGYYLPLYFFDEIDESRHPNFAPKLWKKLKEAANHPDHGEPDEVQTFDYIYGVLHSPDYRETYKEFLKSDFPRIPYPKTPDIFWHVADKGNELRQLHLMEDAVIGETPYPLIGDGGKPIDKIRFDGDGSGIGKVVINASQYFDKVPEIAWNFYIGGYQPAQKWLKDRKGRMLSFDDILHYQKIIKILSETDRIMKEIKLPLD